MAFLENFTDEQKHLLVALPYRVGLWVSESDSSGGDSADEAEKQALETIVCGFAEDFCKSEVTEELMHATVEKRKEWGGWAQDINQVPSECRQAVEWVAEYADYKNVAAFKENLMEIAVAVAMAYREFDDELSLAEKVPMYVTFLVDRLMAFVMRRPPKNHDEIFNISRAERLALTELADALKRDEREGKDPIDVYADENIDPNVGKKIRFEDAEVEL